MSTDQAGATGDDVALDPFAWLLEVVEARFGPTLRVDVATVHLKSDGRIVRLVNATRQTDGSGFKFKLHDDLFHFLALGLNNREEVWIVPRSAMAFEQANDCFVDFGDVHQDPEDSVLRSPIGTESLRDFLVFPTKRMLVDRRKAARKAARDEEAALLQQRRAEREASQQNAEQKKAAEKLAKQRAKTLKSAAKARLRKDADLATAVQRVETRLGPLTPNTPNNWVTDKGEVVHISLSKPNRNTVARAFISIAPAVLKCDWLAVAVRGSEAAWLIPMSVAGPYLKSKQRGDERASLASYLGHRNGRELLWFDGDIPETSLLIEDFMLHEVSPDQVAAEEKAMARERNRREAAESAARAHAAEARVKALAKLESDVDGQIMLESLSRRLGELAIIRCRPYVAATVDNAKVRFSSYTPWFAHDQRALFKVSPDWLKFEWIAIAIKGRPGGWLIPAREIENILRSFPQKTEKDGAEFWEVFAGSRDGTEKLWLGSHYNEGAQMLIGRYRFE